MENPKTGGVWIRDPKTGALTPAAAEPPPVITPEVTAEPEPAPTEPEPAAEPAAPTKKKGR